MSSQLYVGSSVSFSSPELMIFLACDRDRELWPGPTPEVRDSRTSRQIWQICFVDNTRRILCAYSKNRVRPELSIPATGQKNRGLWGREWFSISSSRGVFLAYEKEEKNDWMVIFVLNNNLDRTSLLRVADLGWWTDIFKNLCKGSGEMTSVHT